MPFELRFLACDQVKEKNENQRKEENLDENGFMSDYLIKDDPA